MTRRERLERKLAKRQEWAGKAEARSTARFDAAHRLVKDIPFGQPILVGHHSEKRHRRAIDRMGANMTKGCEESDLAKHHASRADGLEAQLDQSIFSDDEDAIPALEARVVALEAERTRQKAVNALYRHGDADGLAALGLSLDTLKSKREIPYPSYSLSNLGARIRTAKERVKIIQSRQARAQAAAAAPGSILIRGDEFVAITFAEKPEWAIIAALKAAGFLWMGGTWGGYRANIPACVTALLGRAPDAGQPPGLLTD
jgi:hypothetical protein